MAEYLADCAVIIANALDVELLVIGGKGGDPRGRNIQGKGHRVPGRRPLARKTHTLRVAISDMANDGAALGAASLVLHAAYAPNTADLVERLPRTLGPRTAQFSFP